LFDVYQGEPLPEGTKSLAYRLTYQAEETLTDEAAAAIRQRIVQALADQLGATLRSA
ncbi:MAG: hypothetical protein D6802_10860, partial [Ardenticatenia bacterium]